MLYVLDERLQMAATAASEKHLVRSALAVVERTEGWLAGGEWTRHPAEVDDALHLANFSADLLACIQLWQWERSGDIRYLPKTLPTSADAIADLKTRIVAEPEWFFWVGPSNSELFELVAGVRTRAYRYCPELGGVFLVAEIVEEALIEALAQLVVQLAQQSNGQPQETRTLFSAVRSDETLMAELASIPGITVAPIASGMNYDVALIQTP